MRIFLTLVCMCLAAPNLWAETIHLKNGQTVEGKIVESTARNIKVEINGAKITYFSDEIEDIDGKPFASVPLANPAAPLMATSSTIDPTKKALILKFIDAFGTKQALHENFELMIKQLPPERAQEADQLRQRINIDEIVERLVPIYDKQFSAEELQAFINFYTSEDGRKLLKSIPILMEKSVAVSAAYIEEKFPQTAK